MKKICFIKHDMTDASGGARVAANLANALCDKYEVHMLSICSDKDTTFYELDEKVKYNVLIKGAGRIREVVFKAVKALKKYLKENDIDIAFSVGVSINPFLIPAVRGTKCKAVSCEHLNCLNEYENDFGQRFCRYLGAKFGHRVVVLTKQDKEAYDKKYKMKNEKVIYIHNWMDESLLNGNPQYNAESKKIVTVARIEPVKGIENIIEVSASLKEQFSDWSWDVYGGGEDAYIEELNKKIKEKGLTGFVNLKGKVTDMYDRYKDYGIFALTSYCEGLPMVLIEAKAKRIPCVSFDCLTGPRDIIRDGVDGYLVPVGDLEGLKDKLIKCMSDRDLRKSLSDNAYGNLDLFKKDAITERWIDFIDSI
ncbi:MAG: glycosyltransferase family 4 protein [Lachnospiraceae bacterium]|nr:glycosyltransferase family 4 protein [Lachnospiraceae bacterium]